MCSIAFVSVTGGLSVCERKMVAVATKLVTCPALLLLEEPFTACQAPCDKPAAQHLLSSLQTAAQKLHINIIVGEEALPEAAFAQFHHVALLDQAGLPAFAGPPQQVSGHSRTANQTLTGPERHTSCCTLELFGSSKSSTATELECCDRLRSIVNILFHLPAGTEHVYPTRYFKLPLVLKRETHRV